MALTIREDAGSLRQADDADDPATEPSSNPSTADVNLFDRPLVVIQPNRSWSAFDARELWAHRELLYFLTLRDLKARYKQTLLGALWVVLQPLLMTLVFTVFLGMLARVRPPSGLPYPVFVYSGLLPWMFISGGILGCSASLIGNANLLTKVYFPRVLLPAANLGTRLLDFAISLVILVGLILIYRVVFHYQVAPTWRLAALPFVLALMTLFTLSVGTFVSSLNVKYRDVGVALPVLIQLWMFTSPIVYPPSYVPEKWRTLYSLNPIVGLIEGFRAALLGTELPILAITFSASFTIIALVCAAYVFRRTEKGFADVI
ncbi:MAG: lipopolysaccharide transport system permease protein [Blastocatellia bacterium]|jgi:lipopolysaccharide transport system permease protein|nr:lipopolysaccharide transport system permease protein [Blastocatellia bacterium]